MSTAFYVDKTEHTFGDTLITFGLARVLAELLNRQVNGVHQVTIVDKGSYYQLTCQPELTSAVLDDLRRVALNPIPLIRTTKNAAALPADAPILDYEQQKEQNNQHYEARKKGAEGDNLPPKPLYWDILRAINPAALPGYNGLIDDWWRVREAQPEILSLLLGVYSQTPNDVESAAEAWKQLDKANGWGIKAVATGQQLYNPDQGKGHNKSKADGLSIGNLDGFWLAEWLKAVGFYEAAVTRQLSGVKDRKTYVVAPRELTFEDSQAVMARFQNTLTSESSVRFDILAAIRYTRTLLEHFSSEPSLMAQLLQRRHIKKRVVAGFHTVFYKDLGNAVATMNISFIGLPGWVEVQSREDSGLFQDLLTELEKLTRQFDESHSDAFALLKHLRDFVSGDDLNAFFRFTDAFPAYYMSMKERGKFAHQLTASFIERLIMSTEKQLGTILSSAGFQNIAYAIRQSTVTAQYKKKQGDRKYDVRYGLGQELSRKARYPETFIAELADFLHKFNAENAQVMETRNGPYRRSIQTTDINDIVGLIDEFGSETVAHLLIAYGYARVPREDDTLIESEQGVNTL